MYVCLCPINVKTAEPIEPKLFMVTHMTPGKVYGKFEKICQEKKSKVLIIEIACQFNHEERFTKKNRKVHCMVNR